MRRVVFSARKSGWGRAGWPANTDGKEQVGLRTMGVKTFTCSTYTAGLLRPIEPPSEAVAPGVPNFGETQTGRLAQ